MTSPKERSLIKEFENATREGRDPNLQIWYPHESIEGGNATLGFGHKLTDEEIANDAIRVGNQFVPISHGLTDRQIDTVLDQDTALATEFVTENFPGLSPNETAAVTSLVFNVGPNTFTKLKSGRKTKAFTALQKYSADRTNTKARDTFIREAFSEKRGFTNLKGARSKGLVSRRGREAELFISIGQRLEFKRPIENFADPKFGTRGSSIRDPATDPEKAVIRNLGTASERITRKIVQRKRVKAVTKKSLAGRP